MILHHQLPQVILLVQLLKIAVQAKWSTATAEDDSSDIQAAAP